MKKLITLALIGLAITAHNAFGQTNTMLNLRKYMECFGFTNGTVDPDDDYIFKAPRAERTGEISNLGGKERRIDTPLELALFSYYTISRISVRPVQADNILPANNPKLADQKLGAAVFQEMQILRFLGDTAAVSRYEAMLKWITDRKNATRAEIEAFYRDNIRGLVSAVVDEEFNGITVPSALLAKIKKVIGDFFVSPSDTTLFALTLQEYILFLENEICVAYHNMNVASNAGIKDNENPFRNTLNELKNIYKDLLKVDFDPTKEKEHNYSDRNFRNILYVLNPNLVKWMQQK